MRVLMVLTCAAAILGGCATGATSMPADRTTAPSVSADSTRTVPAPRIAVRFRLASGKPVEGYRAMADRRGRPVYVAPGSVMSESDIVRARVVEDRTGKPAVGVTFGDESARRFEDFTGAHIGRQLAILVDGELITVATIRAKLGRLVLIVGDFSRQRAEEIAEALCGG